MWLTQHQEEEYTSTHGEASTLKVWSHGQIGLQDYDWIWAIYHPQFYGGDIIELAVGDHNSETVHSLHACEVSDFQSDIALDDNIISEDSISVPQLIHLQHNYIIGSYHTSTQVVIHCSDE